MSQNLLYRRAVFLTWYNEELLTAGEARKTPTTCTENGSYALEFRKSDTKVVLLTKHYCRMQGRPRLREREDNTGIIRAEDASFNLIIHNVNNV